MNQSQSTNLWHNEQTGSTSNENDRLIKCLKNEEKELRRSLEWVLERQHEILERQMILNYEEKRASITKDNLTSSPDSRSKSNKPSYHQNGERPTSSAANNSDTMFKKLDESASKTIPLFDDLEDTQISTADLRQIKVDIHRNIPTRELVTDLQQNIVNPEDVIPKRKKASDFPFGNSLLSMNLSQSTNLRHDEKSGFISQTAQTSKACPKDILRMSQRSKRAPRTSPGHPLDILDCLEYNKNDRLEYNNNESLIMCLREEEKKLRRRQDWMREQELEKQHKRLKRQRILDYERKRAEAMKDRLASSHHSRSKSRSKSPLYHRHREGSTSRIAIKSNTMYKKAVPLLKDPESASISTGDLCRIKVDIHKDIPSIGPVTELQRDILNPEDVILKRREGEGCKPIFDRDEIKKVVNKMEEQRTIIAIDDEQSDESRTSTSLSSRRYPSLNPNRTRNRGYSSIRFRNRSYSPERLSICHTRYRSAELKHDRKTKYYDYRKSHRRDRDRSWKRDRNRDRYRDQDRDRDPDLDQDRDRDRDQDRDRDRDWNQDRDRNKDRFRDRKDTSSHYVEHIFAVSPYYGNIPPSPIIINPMVTFPRGQVPPLEDIHF